MSFTAGKNEDQSLETLVAKQMGVSRFLQRWLSEDHAELREDTPGHCFRCAAGSSGFRESCRWGASGDFGCMQSLPGTVEKFLRKPLSL